jgi:hydroxymethylglutaryl-CoA lyase
MSRVKIIECPRDAMQGIKDFIPTEKKVQYIQALLRVGFDTIDFGSFVSPKAIPQMQDTAEVLAQLDLSQTQSKLLAIIANTKGAELASVHKEIQYLGFPFSISENFQMRNTHKTIAESLITLQEILEIANQSNKEVVTYISMGFGNPYGDPWNVEIVGEWTEKLAAMGVKILSLSDTIGSSTPEVIDYLFSNLIPKYPQCRIWRTFAHHTRYLVRKSRCCLQSGLFAFRWCHQRLRRLSNGKRRFNRQHANRKVIILFHRTKSRYQLPRHQF